MTRSQINEELVAIANETGGNILPEIVIERAKNPASKLHPLFEWNDSRAGHLHRLDTARGLIREIHWEVRTVTHTFDRVPKYVKSPEASRVQGYIELQKASLKQKLGVLQDELERMSGVIERGQMVAAAILPDLLPTFDVMRRSLLELQHEIRKAAVITRKRPAKAR